MKKVKKVIAFILIASFLPGLLTSIPIFTTWAHLPPDPSIKTPMQGFIVGIGGDVLVALMLLFLAVVFYLISGENIIHWIWPNRNPKP